MTYDDLILQAIEQGCRRIWQVCDRYPQFMRADIRATLSRMRHMGWLNYSVDVGYSPAWKKGDLPPSTRREA